MPYDDESPHHSPIPPSPSSELVPYRALPPRRAAREAERARRVLVACAIAVTAGVAGIMALIYPSEPGDGPDPVAEQIIDPSPWDFVPSAPVSMLPAPASSFASPPPTFDPAAADVTTSPARRRAAPTGVSQTRSLAPAVDLVVGTTVTLGQAGRPGYVLRHRDFIGRIENVTASSSDQDRADSRFIVRKGLGRDSCFSLESANYPGYFLRHRDFILRLEQPGRRDRSNLFTEDATFCTVPTSDRRAVTLESINYSGWALNLHTDGIVHLDNGSGTPFAIKAPL